ncbi:methyltransferase [Podospora fimiseda]|uniref:tRNA wybutosine-synthesizing protein 4 n=1 Tax=Podospora fimiseda TaxID=252190 RepID=A0AAN7BRV3_9PEZI|nr:methyltransferase [Podospora fimiseda]
MTRKHKPPPNPDDGNQPLPKSAQAKAQDDQVMGTNSSSIVSKRSVEKLYYPSEPPFFRYFVKKFQRRSPLINRGYWLRLRVIDVLVRDFLRRPLHDGKRKKVVVNLGCGSDVLPWQCITRYKEDCEVGKVVFVDVDFPELIERKKGVVLGEEGLRGKLTGVREGEGKGKDGVVLRSEEYVMVGCDLRDLKKLGGLLREAIGLGEGGGLGECEFVFVAEVSITYMEREGADGVLGWASTVGDAEFVLLEQILPDGEDHPFASTMLSHFDKLNTQLKSVHVYPTVKHQYERFTSLGWEDVKVWTLWQAWVDEIFLSSDERRRLDDVEPFDEWEEFALFASHYCVVRARTVYEGEKTPSLKIPDSQVIPTQPVEFQFDETAGSRGQRRFAAAMQPLEENTLLNVFGLGPKSRLQNCDVYGQGEGSFTFGEGGPSSRMCHSITDLGDYVLLIGGRGSPSSPLKDCWIFDKEKKLWGRLNDLPMPLYRHSVTAIGKSGMVLLFGGRREKEIFGGCLAFHPACGWRELEVDGDKPTAVYGAVLCSSEYSLGGIYAGGIDENGLLVDQVLSWKANFDDVKKPRITFTRLRPSEDLSENDSYRLVTRFGASCVRHGDEYILVGGVARDHILSHQDEVLAFSTTESTFKITRRIVRGESSIPRPLFTGHSTVSLKYGQIVTMGGGATCFSMGTFWNKGVYTLSLPSADDNAASGTGPRWVHERTVDIIPGERSTTASKQQLDGDVGAQIKPIERVQLKTKDDFIKIVQTGQPVVLEGLDVGSCVSAWTLEHIAEKIGKETKVVVHEAASQVMDFNAKNFKYVTTEFGDFAKRVARGDKLYLRALSNEKPSEKPAVLAEDFQALAADFVLPEQLSLVEENLFSSVLRLSGPVNMWLHYDVMANVYCQIGGSKRLILFPPSDVEFLSFAPGASSSSIDVFSSLGSPELMRTHPHEAVLGRGEILFLPPLWLHTATPTSDASIAVNVFFKDLSSASYSAGRDVYGNRDLAAYEKGRQDVARIAKSFEKIPAAAREFYILRLAEELRRKAI